MLAVPVPVPSSRPDSCMNTNVQGPEGQRHLCARPGNGVVALAVVLSVSACAVTERDHDDGMLQFEASTLWVPADGAGAAGHESPENDSVGQSQLLARPQQENRLDPVTEQIGSGSGSAVDLLDVLSKAQDYDADFQAAITSRSIAQRSVPIARSALLPQVSLGYAGGYYDFKSDSSDDYVGQQLSLTLSQSIYDRANAIAVEQAKLTGSSSDLELQAAHEDLVIRVATSYFNVLKALSELEYRQSDVEATNLQLRQTRSRYEVGTIAVTDVAEAKAQADLAVASEITAKANLDAALQALEVSTGLSLTADIAPLKGNIPMESPDPANVDAWVQTALANNKSLLIARHQIEIAQQQVAQTRASRLPVVSLTGYLSGIDSDYDAGEDVSAEGYTGGSLRLGVDVPLTTGGRISAQISQEQDRAQLATDQTLAVERQVVQTTRDTYRGVVAAISRVAALSQAMQSTRQATEATRSGFQEGTRTSVDVLGSQRDTFRAQTELTAARYDYVLQVLQLKRISGTLEFADIQRINEWLG